MYVFVVWNCIRDHSFCDVYLMCIITIVIYVCVTMTIYVVHSFLVCFLKFMYSPDDV